MEQRLWVKAALSYTYIGAWITMSAVVIMFNKWVISSWGFHFPITLTCWHMLFSSVLSFLIVRSGLVDSVDLSRQQYIQSIVPIGALFSGTLWFGNAAYTYLSVSFIQMLKALMPAAVYTAGIAWGVNRFDWQSVAIMGTVTFGVMLASYGEIYFVLTGVLFMLGSICTESNRIVLVQKLLQAKGVQLNPITTMYYVSPCCLAFLSIPWLVIELPELRGTTTPKDRWGDDAWLDTNGVFIFLANAVAAFMLNCTVFLLIGNTSALTMNLAGVVKDWRARLLIYLSYHFFGAPVSAVSLGGYLIAFLAVLYYNYLKFSQMRSEDQRKHDPSLQSRKPRQAGGKGAEPQYIRIEDLPAEEMKEVPPATPPSPAKPQAGAGAGAEGKA